MITQEFSTNNILLGIVMEGTKLYLGCNYMREHRISIESMLKYRVFEKSPSPMYFRVYSYKGPYRRGKSRFLHPQMPLPSLSSSVSYPSTTIECQPIIYKSKVFLVGTTRKYSLHSQTGRAHVSLVLI